MYNYEKNMEAKQSRRMKAEGRFLTKMEKKMNEAEKMIGELCREGKTIYYVFPDGGKYKEGTFGELVDYLIRNKYV